MSDQIERVIRSLRHLWAQPDATIEQFAAEAVAALRPELEDAERWQVHMRFMDDGRGAAARHQEWIDAARQDTSTRRGNETQQSRNAGSASRGCLSVAGWHGAAD